MKAKCPICRKTIEPNPKNAGKPTWLPFCSERCKLIDLGKWLDSDYRISVETDSEPDRQQDE
jgi:endogenous inhibitor of DNA gyrase (YacG/DUF329 family)